MSSEWVMFCVGLVLVLGTGVFVAAEFAMVNLDRSDLEARASRGERGLGLVIRGLRRTSTHLSSAQLGITLTTLLTGFIMEPAIVTMLLPLIEPWGWPMTTLSSIATIIAVTFATLLSMLIGELIPKNFALAVPLRTAQLVMPLQMGFTTLFRPVVWTLNSSANKILRAVGIEPKEELSAARSADELASLVRRSAQAGKLEEDTATLLNRTLAFNELTASDVMTPRPRMAALNANDPTRAVLELSRTTGFSRFPVIDETLDDVVGIVHVKYALALPRDKRDEVPVSALMMTEPLRVPETMQLDSLMTELRGRGYQLAIVVDEYGGTAGIATLEDLVEELVGEVSDEHDKTRAGIVTARGVVTFPGVLRPDEVKHRIGLEIPDEGPYETAAGYVMSELGEVPKVGDEVSTPDGTLTVVRMEGRRIDRIRFTPTPIAPLETPGGDK
jgi:CBS domain containing-hemolysin-like protein